MNARTAHLLAQDSTSSTGLGLVALVFGGVWFLVLLGAWILIERLTGRRV